MGTNPTNDHQPERRSEHRSIDQRYYSVQFTTEGLGNYYQFKLWNVSPKGMCILVKEESAVLEHLAVGDTIDMTYYLSDGGGESERLRTEIKHITQNDNGRFRGHCLVGLAIV